MIGAVLQSRPLRVPPYLQQLPVVDLTSKVGTTPFLTVAKPTGAHLQFGPHLHEARPQRGRVAAAAARASFWAGVRREFWKRDGAYTCFAS